MSPKYMCMPEFSAMQASILFSASCFYGLEKSIPLVSHVYFPQIFSSAVPAFVYSFLAILLHSLILSCENVKKSCLHFVIFIPFVRFIYRHNSSTYT